MTLHFDNQRKETPIVTLNEVAHRLELNGYFAKGIAVGLGLTIHKIGNVLVISERDFERMKRHLEKTEYPNGNRAGRPLATATATT